MIKRRDFLKIAGVAITAPIVLKGEVAGEYPAKAKITPKASKVEEKPVTEYAINKIFAVPKDEKIYLDYCKIKQTTQKPLMRIFSWEGNLKYVYLPLDEIKTSDRPLPRFYVEFESIQPLEKCDLIIIENRRETRHKEYIVVGIIPIGEKSKVVEQFPVDYRCNYCSWTFDSLECGYIGNDIMCFKSFGDCKSKGNEARFGGFRPIEELKK